MTNFPVNHECMGHNDLVVTNYTLNVKSSTFSVCQRLRGGWGAEAFWEGLA